MLRIKLQKIKKDRFSEISEEGPGVEIGGKIEEEETAEIELSAKADIRAEEEKRIVITVNK